MFLLININFRVDFGLPAGSTDRVGYSDTLKFRVEFELGKYFDPQLSTRPETDLKPEIASPDDQHVLTPSARDGSNNIRIL